MTCEKVPGFNWCRTHKGFPKDCPSTFSRPVATPAANPSANFPPVQGPETSPATGFVSGPPAYLVEVTVNKIWLYVALIAVAVERLLPIEYSGMLVDLCTARAHTTRVLDISRPVALPLASEWVAN